MQTLWTLGAETVLYAVALCGEKGIYGVRNVIATMDKKEFPALKVRADDELLRVGCAEMDFNGKITLADEFTSIVHFCCKAKKVMSLDLKDVNGQQHYTYFIGDGQAIRLKDVGGLKYKFASVTADELATDVSGLVDLPVTEKLPEAALLESGALHEQDPQKLIDQGCPEETANLIVSSVSGKGKFSAMQVIQDEQPSSLFLITAKEGILEVGLDYSNEREDVSFSPLSKEQAVAKIHSTLTNGEE